MCGIVGVLSNKNKAGLLAYEALKKLDYRGYDSWGVGVICDGRTKVYKKVGRISTLPSSLRSGSIAIGHTRWATHGKVSIRNAHPQASQSKNILVVHNGIIENFQELKGFLKKRGFSFQSDTDTEVLPNLIEFYMSKRKDFKEAVRSALNKIKGCYAITAITNQEKNIIAAKKSLPLVIGIGNDGEKFVASDFVAIAGKSNRFIFMKDNEMAILNENTKFFNILNGTEIKKRPKKLFLDLKSTEKGCYAHYMLKEIHEIPLAIINSCSQPKELIDKAVSYIKKADTIFLIGCGTSYHAAMLGSHFFRKITKNEAISVLAPEIRNYKSMISKNSVVIALSQSGETADVLDAVRFVRNQGAKVISMTNVFGSTLTRLSNLNFMMNAGPEICVASTKNYLAQLSLLYFLACAVVGKREKAKEEIKTLSKKAEETIKTSKKKAKMLAEKFKNTSSIFVIGRDENAVTALEGALKVKEVSYVHAEGLSAAELKHGTIALIEKGVPVLVVCKNGKDLTIHNACEVKSRGAIVIGISPEHQDIFDYTLKIPKGKLSVLLSVIPLQLFAYYLAVARKKDPDKPRNLAKSVTVR
ncbi:MAG: glutamine--fructose-6-phosphate transaminase (isomerizing) [Candidatus Diapherotrites archaeon]